MSCMVACPMSSQHIIYSDLASSTLDRVAYHLVWVRCASLAYQQNSKAPQLTGLHMTDNSLEKLSILVDDTTLWMDLIVKLVKRLTTKQNRSYKRWTCTESPHTPAWPGRGVAWCWTAAQVGPRDHLVPRPTQRVGQGKQSWNLCLLLQTVPGSEHVPIERERSDQ